MWFHKSTIRCKTVHTTSSPSPASSQSWSILRQENWSGRERTAWKGWKLGGQTILVQNITCESQAAIVRWLALHRKRTHLEADDLVGGCPKIFWFRILKTYWVNPNTPNAKKMVSCAVDGGCACDYLAVAISAVCFILLLSRMSLNFLKFEKTYWWQSCYLWAVWIGAPLGFGLLLSCRISQAFQLYYIFVKRCLPPIRSYIFLPLILLPWFAWAALIQIKRPLNHRCHVGTQWIIPDMSLHALYVAILVGFTGAIRHIEFRFDELRDLWQGILVSASSIGVWVVAHILNEIHDDISGLQVASRFVLLVTASILVLALFSISSSQPLLSQISLRKREPLSFETMGKALGIPNSGMLLPREPAPVVDPNEPLDKLLMNKIFRQSFMEFANSCLAGESVHFYEEVHELGKIPADDPVRRIYMARHIIDKYIIAGAAMEVNISHRSRQAILTTSNLAQPNLFNDALNELIQLMKTSLAKDFWSSIYSIKFKEEASMRSHELEQMTSWNPSPTPRLSSVHGVDDPFHQEQES